MSKTTIIKDIAIIKKDTKVVNNTRKNLDIFVVSKFSKIISSGSGAGVTSINSVISLYVNSSFFFLLHHLFCIFKKINLKK